jgi:hypothetical protein
MAMGQDGKWLKPKSGAIKSKPNVPALAARGITTKEL